ncbi:MAG: hypothetical protein FWF03_03250 [Defluviitaleaceae bacterium]|nr:hypothetical protein [Defluviitaleaceae bacterium]
MTALIIIAAVVATFSLILFAPIGYLAEGTFGDDPSYRIVVTWLVALVRVEYANVGDIKKTEFRVTGIKIKKRAPNARQKPLSATTDANAGAQRKRRVGGAKKTRKTGERKWNKLVAALTYPDAKIIIGLSIRLIKKLFASLKPDRFNVEGTIGLSDPAETGALIGAYESISGFIPLKPRLVLRGDFNGASRRFEVSLRGRFSAASVLGPVCWFCTRGPVFKLIREKM